MTEEVQTQQNIIYSNRMEDHLSIQEIKTLFTAIDAKYDAKIKQVDQKNVENQEVIEKINKRIEALENQIKQKDKPENPTIKPTK